MKSSTYYDFLLFFFFFFFLLKPRFPSSHHKNLKISRNTLQSQISYLTDSNASVHVKYQSNKLSLSNPTHESKIRISNDMQCSNKLNTPMTRNPQLWCKSCPINNIATKEKNYIDKNKQTDRIFVHTPKLKWHIVSNVARNTLQWDEEPKCAKGQGVPRTWTWKHLSKN